MVCEVFLDKVSFIDLRSFLFHDVGMSGNISGTTSNSTFAVIESPKQHNSKTLAHSVFYFASCVWPSQC